MNQQEQEAYVRARWKRVYFAHRRVIAAFDGDELILGGDYAAAYDFTVAREEEIRQLEADITWATDARIDGRSRLAYDTIGAVADAKRRILARLQRDLEALTKGMVQP